MVCLLRTSSDRRMLFAAVTHLVEVLSLEIISGIKGGKVSNKNNNNVKLIIIFHYSYIYLRDDSVAQRAIIYSARIQIQQK
jgi:hypothetical protein